MAKRAAKPKTDLQERLVKLIGKLQAEADSRVSKRKAIEDRWILDIQQFYGQYPAELVADLENQDKSTLFINETMPKTLACSARLFDMLFPTDDRNWGIKPTPVPTLAQRALEGFDAAREAVPQIKAKLKAGDQAAADAMAAEANAQAETAEKAEEIMKEAKRAAEAMQEEIDDQLKECMYAAEAREVIEDMAKVGAAVVEGPVASDRIKQVWKVQPVIDPKTNTPLIENGQPVVKDVLVTVVSPKPAARRVDFWGFFPESDAMKPEESADFYVRRLLNERRLRQLAKQPGFDKDVIRELLKDGPDKGSLPGYLKDLRAIANCNYDTSEKRYVVWEYRGQMTAEDFQDVCACLSKDDASAKKYAALAQEADDIDPLDELNVVLWFCQGKCLKFGIHHLDRGDSIYSVVPLEKDGASMWGLGIPALMRDPQSALNGAWRMMMDNGALSSGPQILRNRTKVTPVDGQEDMYPRKIWDVKPGTQANEFTFDTFDIQSNQSDYAAMINMSRTFIDTMSGQPLIAQGEQPTGITKTLGGMAMLMNSANVLIRRIVRNFDDRLTTPLIRRFYDWNMQFNPKREIKGDFDVDARGSSVLLVKELQSQNMMAFALNFGGHPVYGKYVKSLSTLRQVAKTNMIPVDDVVKTDAEVKAEEEAQAAQGTPKTPEEIKAEAAMNLENLKHEHRMDELRVEENIAMMKLAAEQNVKLEDIRAWAADRDKERQSKERLFAAEAAMESRNAGGSGSGGYLSAPPKQAAA